MLVKKPVHELLIAAIGRAAGDGAELAAGGIAELQPGDDVVAENPPRHHMLAVALCEKRRIADSGAGAEGFFATAALDRFGSAGKLADEAKREGRMLGGTAGGAALKTACVGAGEDGT